MKTLNLLMACLFFAAACTNSSKGNSVSTNSDSTIKWSKLLSGSQCSMESPMNAVITSQEELDALWAKAFMMDMPPEKLQIDFTKNSVILLFLGVVNKGGHSVEITAIKTSMDKGVQIEAEHKLPGKNCMSTMAIEYPYYIALTDNVIAGKNEITATKKEVDCE